MKFLGYFFAGLLGLAVLGVSILWGGAQMSLDQSYAHTKAAAQLRDFADNDADGVVRIATSRGDFRARIAGFQDSGERPLVVLLHGFPVTSAMWIDLIAPLSEAGYRVVAFDQRGYSPGVRPQVVSGMRYHSWLLMYLLWQMRLEAGLFILLVMTGVQQWAGARC